MAASPLREVVLQGHMETATGPSVLRTGRRPQPGRRPRAAMSLDVLRAS
ncbi:hypothetical protein AB5J52_37880 [Streptomyces sp. R39]|uniref:Uncharacterized protein n=1 Tax=Streptomyces sp. R39 TaxID=3238631 RepID=A0AB39QY85_9ACTN